MMELNLNNGKNIFGFDPTPFETQVLKNFQGVLKKF